ncbi:acyl-CoA N-acyltransferase [Sporodiniella umbellata]|nr:acyl-CoA N-acyltransferase [Sporodiniella umbellata]
METEIPPHPAAANVVDFSDWVSEATGSLSISLVQPQQGDSSLDEPVQKTTFQPDFTYPIVGDHEQVFGYKDLAINLQYTSGSLQPYLDISFSSKYEGSYPVDDIRSLLQECLPKGLLSNQDRFYEQVMKDHQQFKPLGEKVHEYSREGLDGEEQFEIYKTTFLDPKFREYHERMKIFILFFIEGGSFIEDDDEKWEIFTTFKKEKSTETTNYHFVGYSTVYPFYYWPENTRIRISQFLMLPPYKKKGHGSELYQTLYELFKLQRGISEITVEDSSEDFADMRDKNDIRYLLEHQGFQGLKAPVARDVFSQLQTEYKLTDRQLHRCLEIYLLSNVDKTNEKEYKTYRLQVKHRLYTFNYDVIQSIEKDDRKNKLHETYLNLEDDYHRILELI